MLYDIEFYVDGQWNFHHQEWSRKKAASFAKWFAAKFGCKTRILRRA